MNDMQFNDFICIIIQSEGLEYLVANYIEIREEFFQNKYAC
jgi:hypothetical protein